LRALGLVAQLVEQRIENPCVGGSIPPRATKNIFNKTPTLTGWRFRICHPQILAPVYSRPIRPSSRFCTCLRQFIWLKQSLAVH
jgi:hypothetical protein